MTGIALLSIIYLIIFSPAIEEDSRVIDYAIILGISFGIMFLIPIIAWILLASVLAHIFTAGMYGFNKVFNMLCFSLPALLLIFSIHAIISPFHYIQFSEYKVLLYWFLFLLYGGFLRVGFSTMVGKKKILDYIFALYFSIICGLIGEFFLGFVALSPLLWV
ncbi:MAG: hypothetical protein ABH950_06860 [Candidatus Altiarchaeota archaeon]